VTGPEGMRLHHIGVVTRGIEKELPFFELLGYRKISDMHAEPDQKVRGMFIAAPGQPVLELLENIEENGPLDVLLERGIKFYHFAYAVADIDQALERILSSQGGKVIVPAAHSSYFRRICFVMLRNMMLIELVETDPVRDANERAAR